MVNEGKINTNDALRVEPESLIVLHPLDNNANHISD